MILIYNNCSFPFGPCSTQICKYFSCFHCFCIFHRPSLNILTTVQRKFKRLFSLTTLDFGKIKRWFSELSKYLRWVAPNFQSTTCFLRVKSTTVIWGGLWFWFKCFASLPNFPMHSVPYSPYQYKDNSFYTYIAGWSWELNDFIQDRFSTEPNM